MLPRRAIRDEFYRLFGDLTIPKTISRGRLYRYHETDLPAINVTTFSDTVLSEERIHAGCKHIEYSQGVVIELHTQVTENYEDELDEMEEEFWEICSAFTVPGVDIQYTGGEVSPVQEVTDTPQTAKLLSFAARYSVDSRTPSVIIT